MVKTFNQNLQALMIYYSKHEIKYIHSNASGNDGDLCIQAVC